MKKERSFRPPQAVLDTIEKYDGEPEVCKLSGASVPLSNLRKMHAFLKRADMVDQPGVWEAQGGNAALMWSHRVLRQEGVLKPSAVGDTLIPEAIDIQLGPTILAGFTKEDVDSVAKKFGEAGVPASLIPVDDGTFAFYAGDASANYAVSKGELELPDVDIGSMVMVDETRNKVNSICKAAKDNVVGVACRQLGIGEDTIDTAWERFYLLKSIDNEGRAVKVLKIDDELGLVIGWAIICTIEDEPYFDKQEDHIPDNGMLQAATDFMMNSRVAKEMHVGDEKGTVVFAWPMTAEIAKAFDIEVHQTGLMIAMKPDNEDMLEKFRDGTYNGFSIGGKALPDFTEEVE
ncbi:MAG: XkdF-like putative serine protease domain-containing protein [Candidatus Thorarchaeota archaeon]